MALRQMDESPAFTANIAKQWPAIIGRARRY